MKTAAARVTAAGLLAFASLCAVAQAAPRPAHSRPSFSVHAGGELRPGFSWRKHDYAIRCDGHRATVRVTGARGWRSQVTLGRFHRRSFVAHRSLHPGWSVGVTFRHRGRAARRFHVRCLPPDFPEYHFTRTRAGGPPFFVIQLGHQYAGIFDRHGVPVWWFKARGEPDNAELLPDGTIAFDAVNAITDQTGDYEIRRLDGTLVRVVKAAGPSPTDIHELLLLPGGNYLVARQIKTSHVDTSPYGGAPDATVIGIQVQELTPKGRVVWRWNSGDHIGLAETPPRWWRTVVGLGQPYDIVHFNSAEPDGKHLLLSFRHLDAVYEINRRTGAVVWKLGGTPTSKSLRVLGDPQAAYPLGGQHDARRQPDGTITIHDNGTGLIASPRAVRYRIDPKARTARLVQSIVDPAVTASICCGSARRLPSGNWLVGWGGNSVVAGYDARGRRLFTLTTPSGFSYRANPVPSGAISAARLRRAMEAMVTG